MSNETIPAWLERNRTSAGLLGLGVCLPGKPALVQACADGVAEPALENAWRCVAETIPVLQLNEFPTAGFRFVYGQAIVHCERRPDGACVAICGARDETQFRPEELYRLLSEFHAL